MVSLSNQVRDAGSLRDHLKTRWNDIEGCPASISGLHAHAHTQAPMHTQRLPHNHNSGGQRTFSERWSQWVVGTEASCAAVRLVAEAWAPSSCFLPFGTAHCGLFPKDPEAGTEHVCFSLSFSLLLTEAMVLSQRDTQVLTAQWDNWTQEYQRQQALGPLPSGIVSNALQCVTHVWSSGLRPLFLVDPLPGLIRASVELRLIAQ